jgi:peptide deformylase
MKLNGQEIEPATAMPLVLINPQIDLGSETEIGTEGCLSFPEITGEIERAKSITVRAQNLDGESIEIETTGFLARAIQHEVDHLNGILFVDRMSSAAKTSLSSKLKRLQKETQRGAKHRQKAVAETTL